MALRRTCKSLFCSLSQVVLKPSSYQDNDLDDNLEDEDNLEDVNILEDEGCLEDEDILEDDLVDENDLHKTLKTKTILKIALKMINTRL